MLKRLSYLMILMSLMLWVTSCEEETPDYAADLIDNYIVETLSYSGETLDFTVLPIEQAVFVSITRSELSLFENYEDPCEDSYTVGTDEISSVTGSAIVLNDGSHYAYNFLGEKLQLNVDGDILTLASYAGVVPPPVWTDPSLLPNDTYEPDNTMATATAIAAGGTVQNHYMGLCEDQDYFMFSALNGTSYVLETTSPGYPDLDLELILFSGAGVELDSDDDSGTDWNPSLFWTCQASGDYYFLVQGWWFGEYGDYSVSVTVANPALQRPPQATEPKKTRTLDRPVIRNILFR